MKAPLADFYTNKDTVFTDEVFKTDDALYWADM